MDEPRQRVRAIDSDTGPRRRGWFGTASVATALGSALATFLVLAGLTPILPTHDVVVWMLLFNVLLVFILIGTVAWEARGMVRARWEGLAGARLHVRLVGLFSLVATLPAILVSLVAMVTLERGLDPWFTGALKTLITDTVDIARAYRDNQCQALARDTQLIAADLSRAKVLFDASRGVFREFMNSRTVFLGFPVAMLLDQDGKVVERIDAKPVEDLAMPTPDDLREANDKDAICLLPREGDIFRAILKLPALDDRILFVARPVDPRALQFLPVAEAGVAYYHILERKKVGIQVAFASMFTLIAMTVLLSAVWFGLNFANGLVAPIRRLIHATDQVATGNFYVQVPIRRRRGRPRPSRQDLQQDDRRAEPPARQPDRGERPHRPAPAFHRGGAVGRLGGRDRHRCGGQITVVNPSAEALLGAARRPASSAGRSRTCCRSSRRSSRKPGARASASSSADPDRARRARADARRPRHQRAGAQTRRRGSSSPSTTSPISSRRSAPPPGPTWRGASRTRSRTR